MNEPAWDGKTERIAGDRSADAGGYFEGEVWKEKVSQVTVTFAKRPRLHPEGAKGAS